MRKAEAHLDFTLSAQDLHNQIRAFYPWPGSQTVFRGEQFKIHRARACEGVGQPGEILLAKKRLVVACGSNALEILEAQLPGKKALTAQAILNGARIQAGEILGTHPGDLHG
jgi:methionyl-tRNA formyltransferase